MGILGTGVMEYRNLLRSSILKSRSCGNILNEGRNVYGSRGLECTFETGKKVQRLSLGSREGRC